MKTFTPRLRRIPVFKGPSFGTGKPGWHGQSGRHSRARKYGRAGPPYVSPRRKNRGIGNIRIGDIKIRKMTPLVKTKLPTLVMDSASTNLTKLAGYDTPSEWLVDVVDKNIINLGPDGEAVLLHSIKLLELGCDPSSVVNMLIAYPDPNIMLAAALFLAARKISHKVDFKREYLKK